MQAIIQAIFEMIALFSLGVVVAAFGQLMAAVREIAINTRALAPPQPNANPYSEMTSASRALRNVGGIISLAALIRGVAAIVSHC